MSIIALRRPLAAALLVAILSSGCSHVPLTTLYKLATFDPVRADPAALRTAVRYPDALEVRKDGATLTLTIDGAAPAKAHEFTLVRSESPDELAPLASRVRPGFTIEVYRLADADVQRVRALQAGSRSGGKGRIGIAAEACRRRPIPAGAVRSSTYLRLDAKQGYLPVVEDIDLRRELGDRILHEKIPPCHAP